MSSAGSQRQQLQKFKPAYKPLISFIDHLTEGASVIDFRVPIPDSRLRVKITVAFAFANGQQPSNPAAVDLSPGGATLWLYESEDDETGTTGTTEPATNIEGSAGAPTPIPQAVGLSAYSREVETAADNIEGRFATDDNGFLGTWVLQVRIQPTTGQRFSDDEWRQICGEFKPIVMGFVTR